MDVGRHLGRIKGPYSKTAADNEAGMQMVNMLIRQIAWAVILILLGRAFMSLAVRKVVIQGG